jgi:hypothetical protein
MTRAVSGQLPPAGSAAPSPSSSESGSLTMLLALRLASSSVSTPAISAAFGFSRGHRQATVRWRHIP